MTLKPSATLQINEKVRFLQEKGKKVYHFGFGQSPFPIHPEIVTSLKEQAENNHYLPVNRLDILRAKIASFLKKNQGISTQGSSIFIGQGVGCCISQFLIFEGHFLVNSKGNWVTVFLRLNLRRNLFDLRNLCQRGFQTDD